MRIVIYKTSTEAVRLGSVSFSLKGFQTALHSGGGDSVSFLQWVTLYDPRDDDLFEGQLGIDDDPEDTPRVLLEYTVIGSKYASNVHSLDEIIESTKVKISNKKYKELRDEASQAYDKEQAGKVKTGTFSVTVEYVDSRAA